MDYSEKEIRDKTLEECRAFFAAEFIKFGKEVPGLYMSEYTNDYETVMDMNGINKVIDFIKNREAVWKK